MIRPMIKLMIQLMIKRTTDLARLHRLIGHAHDRLHEGDVFVLALQLCEQQGKHWLREFPAR